MLLVTLQLFLVMLNHFFELVLTYPNGRFLWEGFIWWFGVFISLHKLAQIWSRRRNNKNSRMHSISFHKTKSTENAYTLEGEVNHNFLSSKKKIPDQPTSVGRRKKRGSNNCILSTCAAFILNWITDQIDWTALAVNAEKTTWASAYTCSGFNCSIFIKKPPKLFWNN